MCIRILYSKKSGILCIHLFNLSPFPSIGAGAVGGNHMQTY